MILFIRHVLPTPWLSIQITPYLIGGKIIQMVFGLILQRYLMAGKSWLKDAFHFTFWDRIFARVRFYKSPFLTPSFQHQDSNSYYLVLATAKISKICICRSLDVYFSICKSQDRAINRQWIIQPKVIDCPSDNLFSFRNSPNIKGRKKKKKKQGCTHTLKNIVLEKPAF